MRCEVAIRRHFLIAINSQPIQERLRPFGTIDRHQTLVLRGGHSRHFVKLSLYTDPHLLRRVARN